MRFNKYDVDIDDELITALRNNTLVVFVGAGVSGKAYPRQKPNSFYPKFYELVEEIIRRMGRQLLQQEKEMLEHGLSDRVLGILEKDFGGVKAIAAEILQENENEQRTDLHRAIIRLFPEDSEPRIVTTNFDNLLIRALDEEGFKDHQNWKSYEAPSLPPAKKGRFKGICYLHGRVTTPQEMILTDKDIGRAYMDEGWALKFAHELFRNFNVLFIGYSLDDPPLRYLSLALEGSSDRKHWAMISDIGESRSKREDRLKDWSRRGVNPILYPAKRKDHRALEITISDWAENNRRGYIDNRNILLEWAKTDPDKLAIHALDCSRYYLHTPELLRDFAEKIENENWFDKLVEWGHFENILKGQGKFENADSFLAQTLIKWLLNDPNQWLVKLVPYRKTINPSLFELFCWEFDKEKQYQNINVNDLRKIIEYFKFIIENYLRKDYSLWIDTILRILIDNNFIDDAVWLFTNMIHTNPDLKATHNYYYTMAKEAGKDTKGINPFRLEMEINSQDLRSYRANEIVNKIFIPKITSTGYTLLISLTSELLHIRSSLKRMGKGRYSYIERRAIEQYDKKIVKASMDGFLLDAIRNVWESLLDVTPNQAIKVCQLWSEINDELIKRLTLHAMRMILEKGYVE